MNDNPTTGEPHASMAWLQSLSDTLAVTEAKVDGVPVDLQTGLDALLAELTSARVRGGRIWFAANGGSAALASHISQDFVMRCGLSSLVLSDPALMTCAANDHGYTQVYAKPLGVHLRTGDLLIAISSSGNSDNILAAVELATAQNARVVTLSAFERDNRLNRHGGAVGFYLPTQNYGVAEIGHEALLHAVIEVAAQQK